MFIRWLVLVSLIFTFTFFFLIPWSQKFIVSEQAAAFLYTKPPVAIGDQDVNTMAVSQCIRFANKSDEQTDSGSLHDKDYKVWEITTGTYVVKTPLEKPALSEGAPDKAVCKLRFEGGDAGDNANWILIGLDLKATKVDE